MSYKVTLTFYAFHSQVLFQIALMPRTYPSIITFHAPLHATLHATIPSQTTLLFPNNLLCCNNILSYILSYTILHSKATLFVSTAYPRILQRFLFRRDEL